MFLQLIKWIKTGHFNTDHVITFILFWSAMILVIVRAAMQETILTIQGVTGSPSLDLEWRGSTSTSVTVRPITDPSVVKMLNIQSSNLHKLSHHVTSRAFRQLFLVGSHLSQFSFRLSYLISFNISSLLFE